MNLSTPKNKEPAARGKMRKIPIISWVAAGRWPETGETFLEEDVIDRIESDISERPTVETSPYDAPFALRDGRRVL